jgi:AmmeMemoRadiSam system protein B
LLQDDQPGPDAHPEIVAAIDYLKEIATHRRTVFIAAADLSHVGPAFGDPDPTPAGSENREQVRLRDEELLEAIVNGDRKQFFELIKSDSDQNKVCGLAPIYMTLWAAGAKTGVWNGYQQCQADEGNTSFVSIAGAALY